MHPRHDTDQKGYFTGELILGDIPDEFKGWILQGKETQDEMDMVLPNKLDVK